MLDQEITLSLIHQKDHIVVIQIKSKLHWLNLNPSPKNKKKFEKPLKSDIKNRKLEPIASKKIINPIEDKQIVVTVVRCKNTNT